MEENKKTSTPCPFCGHDATLKEDTMTIQSGLTRVKVPASHYECTSCKRTFSTHQQRSETANEVAVKRGKLVHPDMRKGRVKRS